jgi:hypothetical protein
MTAARLARTITALLGTLAATTFAVPGAFAQASVKAIFEKYNLLGTFAMDCSKPAAKNNLYYLNRPIDADHVQRDQMTGPTTRQWVAVLDKATEVKPNEIAVSGTREGKPTDGVWRVERRGDDVRILTVEASLDGKKLISGGKVVANGRDWPWQNKCGK